MVLKTTIAEKPEGPTLWATEKTAATTTTVNKCNMQVTVGSFSSNWYRALPCDIQKWNFKPFVLE